MKKVEVFFRGWGQEWALGTLAQNGSQVLFEYSRAALEKRIEFSRLNVPLTPQTYSGFPQYLLQLPGFIADALPT
ncbi:HipA N-terminal domain-containing protein [Ideonella azotifigens]|uniref:HipA N-terminal subdomain 1 domain-containing protein n=1 Tax=Ideonella azotifigens TaxID=513160 RepID=A0ABN1K8K0_9BURK|nr:HipA N-terminal domain-containing protein [Ideonella azotifigens]MCD2342880.1 HipA N-terminal domain-containing protein [Ideonella azotifigens]